MEPHDIRKIAVDELYGARNDGLVMDQAAVRVANAVLAAAAKHLREVGHGFAHPAPQVILELTIPEA